MLATTKGEGGVVFSVFQEDTNRPPPFLRRNVKRVVWYLTMGSTFSTLKEATVGTRQREELVASEDEDEDARPLKRRRINPFEEDGDITSRNGSNSGFRHPLGHVTNESTRALRLSSKPPLVDPSDFYGRPRSSAAPTSDGRLFESVPKSRKKLIDSITTKAPVELQKSLRVDILGVVSNEHEVLNLPGNRKNSIDIKCRCSAAIFYAKNDENPGAPIRPQDYIEVCRTIKTGILRVTVGRDGEITRDLILPEPFIFSSEELFVNRRKRSGRSRPGREDLETVFDFADSYSVQVSVEPVGFQEHWPPLNIPSFTDLTSLGDGYLESHVVSKALSDGKATNNDLHLYCKTALLVDPERQCKAVNLSICYRSLKQTSSYVLRLRIRWAIPSSMSALPTPPKFESPRRTMSKVTAHNAVPPSPLANKTIDISAPNSPADSRAQRRRPNVPTYNLKTLSAQAQGKSPRVRKTRDVGSKSDQRLLEDPDEISITYCFGRADSADNGIKQQHLFAGLRCPFCGCDHGSLDELRLHLHGEHHNYKFHLRRPKPPRITYYVEVVRNRSSPLLTHERARTLQMGRPGTLFDLEKYLNGDDSWTRAREGPNHNHGPHLIDRGQESSLSSSPHGSRYSSPNTSNSMDDLFDFETHEMKLPVRPRKVFRVPKTNKPLYDTVTKRVLEPGEEIPSSDDEKDESWFHQKHRDIINDFEDITAEEKDYINQWNPFIVNEQLTSEKYLPESILRFVESNKGWFIQKRTRKTQFLKHMETFILRGVVSEDYLHKSLGILRAAEARKGKANADMNRENEVEEVSPSKHRGLLDCICCEHTQPPDRVVCRGEKCKGRYFHRECAKKLGRPIVGKWKCDHCLSP